MASCPTCGGKKRAFASHCNECISREQQRSAAAARAEAVENESPAPAVDEARTSTTFDLPGFAVTASHGVARGLTVRSRGVAGNVMAGIESVFGGEIMTLVSLCEAARLEAFNRMLQAAHQMGANAVLGVRFETSDVFQGITEVLAYGTAVTVAPNSVP